MKKSSLYGIIFTVVLGILLHFTYILSNNNIIFALFSAVNESTWEHLKLIFFPFVIYSIFEYVNIGKYIPNYITAKFLGISFGLISIPILFYSYIILLKKDNFIIDISIFLISVVVSYLICIYVYNNKAISFNIISLLLIILIMICFFIFTFYPPHLPLFLDPVTKTYGV